MDSSELTAIPLNELAIRIAKLISAAGLAGIDVSLTEIGGVTLGTLLSNLLPKNQGSATQLSIDGSSMLAGQRVADILSGITSLETQLQNAQAVQAGLFAGGVWLIDQNPIVFIGCSTSRWDATAIAKENAEIGIIFSELSSWAQQKRTAAIAAQDAAKAKGQ